MDTFLAKDFGKLIKQNLQKLRHFWGDSESNIGRLYDFNLGQLPLTVDLWGPYILITAGRLPASIKAQVRSIVANMAYTEESQVLFSSEAKGKRVKVKEWSVEYTVELFAANQALPLSQSLIRQELLASPVGQEVLIIGARGGGLSVCCAYGGAAKVTSYEDNPSLRSLCEENLIANNFKSPLYNVLPLSPQEALNTSQRYDFVVVDEFLDYRGVAKLLKAGGRALIITNRPLSVQGQEITRSLLSVGFSAKRSKMRCYLLKN